MATVSSSCCIIAGKWPLTTRAEKTNQGTHSGKFDWVFFSKNIFHTSEPSILSLFYIHSANFVKLTFEVYLSNFIAPIYEAISSYYLTSSASHLTSISELLSGVFLAMTDSDRFGTLTAVKWYWMAAFNHNTVLSCRQTAECRCACVWRGASQLQRW